MVLVTIVLYLGINLTTDTQDMYTENYTLLREIKNLSKLWDVPHLWTGRFQNISKTDGEIQ